MFKMLLGSDTKADPQAEFSLELAISPRGGHPVRPPAFVCSRLAVCQSCESLCFWHLHVTPAVHTTPCPPNQSNPGFVHWLQSGVCLPCWPLLQVNARLRDIVDNHSSLWARVKFGHTWPSPKTLWLFERYLCSSVSPIQPAGCSFHLLFFKLKLTCLSCCRAAEKGNFEAAVKLGVAFLYNEGRKLNTQRCLPDFRNINLQKWGHFCSSPRPALLSDEGRADVCGRKASHFFSLAESLRSPLVDPFIWVFIRPPWSTTGSCCKAVVFEHLKAECENNAVKFASSFLCVWDTRHARVPTANHSAVIFNHPRAGYSAKHNLAKI